MDNNDKREKITIASRKDFEVSYYVGPGHGGQKKQKTHSGVQIIHKETGAIGRCSESRSQAENKGKAFQNLLKTPKMKIWINKKLFEIREKESMEEQIEKKLNNPNNVKYEIKEDGKWVEVKENYFETEQAKQAT